MQTLLENTVLEQDPAPAQGAAAANISKVTMTLVCDCVALPDSGYACQQQIGQDCCGFAVTMAIRSTLTGEEVQMLRAGNLVPRLLPWRSAVRGVTFLFYRPSDPTNKHGPHTLVHAINCAFSATEIKDPEPIKPLPAVSDATIKLFSGEQNTSDFGYLTAINDPTLKCEPELNNFLRLTNFGTTDTKPTPDIIERWFNRTGSFEVDDTSSTASAPTPGAEWSFEGYCLELAKIYPINTRTHVGFVVPIPKKWLLKAIPMYCEDEELGPLRVIAVPMLGNVPGASSHSLLNTASPATVSDDAQHPATSSSVVELKLHDDPTLRLISRGQPKLVRPLPDKEALLNPSTLFIQTPGGSTSTATNLRDAQWMLDQASVEGCVHRSFELSRLAASQWEILASSSAFVQHNPRQLLPLFQDWIASLRELTGLGAWRESEDCFLEELCRLRGTCSPKDAGDCDPQRAANDRSRYRSLAPEQVLREWMVRDGAKAQNARKLLTARNLVRVEDAPIYWARALCDGLRAANRDNPLIEALVDIVKPIDQFEIDARLLEALTASNVLAISDALINEDVLQEVVIADWLIAADAAAARAAQSDLARELSLYRVGGENVSYAAMVRRSLAAPLWEHAVNEISPTARKAASDNTPSPPPPWISQTVGMASVALSARGSKVDPSIDASIRMNAVEYSLIEPKLRGDLHAAITYTPPANASTRTSQSQEKSPIRKQIEEIVLNAAPRHIARPAGSAPNGISVRIDRYSSPNATDTEDNDDFARRINGFGVLVRRRDPGDPVPAWSCANMAVRGIDGLSAEIQVLAQGADDDATTANARELVRKAIKDSKGGVGPNISPMRFGFVNGLRQSTLAYDGRSLVGDVGSQLWPEELRPIPKHDEKPKTFASPLFWLSPVIPKLDGAAPRQLIGIPEMFVGSDFDLEIFAVLQAGALPPAIASDEHPCIARMEVDQTPGNPSFERIPCRRDSLLGVPQITPCGQTGKSLFSMTTQAVECMDSGDLDSRVLDRVRGIDVGCQLTLHLPASDLHHETPLPPACRASLEVVLQLLLEGQEPVTLFISRSPAVAPDDTFVKWTMKMKAGDAGQSFSIPANADVDVVIRRVENILQAEFAAYLAVQNSPDLKPAGLLNSGSGLMVVSRDDISRTVLNTPFRIAVINASSRRMDVDLKLRTLDETPTLIGRPELRIDGQSISRADTGALGVDSSGQLLLQVKPPSIDLESWMRWPRPGREGGGDSARNEKGERTGIRMIDQLLRLLRAPKVGDKREMTAGVLAVGDPAVTHLIFELVPLFRPDGRTAAVKPMRCAIPLKTCTLWSQIGPRETDLSAISSQAPALIKCARDLAEHAALSYEDIKVICSSVVKLPGHDELASMLCAEHGIVHLYLAEGEAAELRCYPAIAKESHELVRSRVTSEVWSELRRLKVEDNEYVVGSASALRLDAVPEPGTALMHVPKAEELFSCLRTRISESKDGSRELLLTLEIPGGMLRRFAYVASVEGRHQEWRWRGEVFPRDPLGSACHPMPELDVTSGTYKVTAWGDQSFDSALLQWEVLAMAGQTDSAYEARSTPYSWRARRTELMRLRVGPRATLHRFGVALETLADIHVQPAHERHTHSVQNVEARLPGSLSVEESAKDAFQDLRRNSGVPEGDQRDLLWKRVFTNHRVADRLPMPKVWMVLPLSRSIREISLVDVPCGERATPTGITSALVLVLGGAFDHAGWGEDIECRVLSATDPKLTQIDVGSVPSSTGTPFEPKHISSVQVCVSAGPIGHTLDGAVVSEPLITAASYVVNLLGIDEWLNNDTGVPRRFDRALDARVQFRRIMRTRGLIGPALSERISNGIPPTTSASEEHASEWTPPVLLRFGVQCGDLAAQLHLKTATFLENKLQFDQDHDPTSCITAARASNYEMWVLLTQLTLDAYTDTERLHGIAVLAPTGKSEFVIAMSGQTSVGQGTELVARVLLVQADLQNNGQGPQWTEPRDFEKLGDLTALAELLLPWNRDSYERANWNEREARARIVGVSEPCFISSSGGFGS